MREILFRGKRLDNGAWVEGCVFVNGDERGRFAWIADINTLAATADGVCGEFVAVDPATVGQYTGERDKNGKRIFEGDIVIVNGYNKTGNGDYTPKDLATVRFEDAMFTHGWVEPYLQGVNHIIVGTIHDGKENE